MNKKRVVVAVSFNTNREVLLTYNSKWGGYSFPTANIADDEPPLGSAAIAALESDIGRTLPDAKAKELEFLGKYGVSDRTGDESIYYYWLYEVTTMPLELEAGEQLPIYIPLADIPECDDVTWTAKVVASELLNNREVSLAVISRLGRFETEYLVIWNDGYEGYFFPATRRKTEVTPEKVAKQLVRESFGYSGEVKSEWKSEIEDIHFSDRFSSDTNFRFHLNAVEFPEIDIHRPFNELEIKLHARGIKWKWLTAAQLSDPAGDLSSTMASVRGSVLASVPTTNRESPLPTSEGAVALIVRQSSEGPLYFAQWNDQWKAYFLIAGRLRDQESPPDCIIRKVSQELNLDPNEFTVAKNSSNKVDYEAISNRTKQLTAYTQHVFDVELPQGVVDESPKAKNRWLTIAEIEKQGADDGREVSPTVILSISGTKPKHND